MLRLLCWSPRCGASASFYFTNGPLSSDSVRSTDLNLIKDALADDNRNALLMPVNAFGSPLPMAALRRWQLPRNLHLNDIWRRCHHPASHLSRLQEVTPAPFIANHHSPALVDLAIQDLTPDAMYPANGNPSNIPFHPFARQGASCVRQPPFFCLPSWFR